MTIKGFIFDLDGVITDTTDYHYLAWKNLGEKMDIEIDLEFNEKLKGISRMDSLERILDYGGKKELYSLQEKVALAATKNEEYVKLIEDISPADLLPGILVLLADLKAAGIKVALASASKNGPIILERLGITADFDEIVDPSLLANGKPDPEIFLKGAKQLGLAVGECIGVEDAEAGIQGINDAQMFSVGVGNRESMKAANYRVSNTADLSLSKILEAAYKQSKKTVS